MPEYTLQGTFNLIEQIMQGFAYDDGSFQKDQDNEPVLPCVDQWRRQNAHLQTAYQPICDNQLNELDDEQFEEKPPDWENYEPQIIKMSEDPETDLYDEHLRSQLNYREEMRKQFEAQQLELEKEKLEEKRKMRVLVDGKPEKVTYDIDGKIILKANKIQLAPVKRIFGQQKIEGSDIISSQEIVTIRQPLKSLKKKPKLKYFKVQPSLQNVDAQKIIAQQERNYIQEFLQVLQPKPGVYFESGQYEKGSRTKHTEAQELPYRVQNKMDQYLSLEKSLSIKLSKEEYSNITLNNSIYQGSYEKSYLQKKTGHKHNITNKTKQSDYDEPIFKEGVVKVNDIGKFYDLLIKDAEVIEDQTPIPLLSPISQITNTVSLNEIKNPLKAELPSIPATQFYKYLEKQQQQQQQQPPSLSRIENSSSVTSKLTRDRSMPEAISNIKKNQCFGAPKIGKFLGFGISQKYKFQ